MKKQSGKVDVMIIMGSKNDHRIMKNAEKILREFNCSFRAKIVSAHRTPREMFSFAEHAESECQVVIAGAGGAAHLPGMVAALTTRPVIGVPISATVLEGLDALLSIAQMPRGCPVATVAIDNAENAALMALRILSLQDEKLKSALKKHQERARKIVTQQKLL